MSDVPQSDVSRPSKLPTANLLPQGVAPLAVDQSSAEYLDAVEEEWNKKVDVEIETLADGMVDLVNLASVCPFPLIYSWTALTFVPDRYQRQVQNCTRNFPSAIPGRVHGAVLLFSPPTLGISESSFFRSGQLTLCFLSFIP